MNSFVKNCKNSSIILCLYMIPIFLYGTYYRDDHGRVISQYFDWDLDGRPLTNIVIKALNFGDRLTDIAPLSQILSIIISAISCGIICTYIVKKEKLSTIISVSLLFLSPFYIQNMLYRFDVVTMGLSIFFAVAPFILKDNSKIYIHCIVSLISILCLLMTYQAAIPVFYASIFLSYICHSNRRNIIVNITRVVCGGISLSVYYFIISPLFVGGGYAKYRAEPVVLSSGEFIETILSNLISLCNYLSALINQKFFIIFSLVISLNIILIFQWAKSKENKKNQLLLFLFFILSFFTSFLIFFFLKKPVYEPRIMIGINSLIMIFGVNITLKNYKNIYINSFVISALLLPTLFFFSIATNYINASKAYISYEKEVIRSMYNDYNSLNLDGKAYINGYLYPPYITDQVLQKIPFLRNIIGSRIGGLTSYLKKSDFPLFEFEGSNTTYQSDISCNDVLKKYNGIYTVVKYKNENYFYLNNIQCQ
ncbi:glucosyltransferase domain-containing protein [Photorhabdus kleinii]|uniref:glucosyltransferase domain-containing protein n=1 Tax=Photorhabdus kleinii TaxID=768034 RepID=UPI0021D49717|nr:glucosyltransferase domain-containing protein [Photorhabdus kleinii]MCT8342238.1 glucosyltransferase domain-containing protein [Photorhabdus kleinii]